MRNINKLFVTILMSAMVFVSGAVFTPDGARAIISPVAEMRAANTSGGSSKNRSGYGELNQLSGIKSPDQERKKSLGQIRNGRGKGQAKHKAGDHPVTPQAGVLPILSAKAAFSAAIATTVGGENTGFAEVELLGDWDGREDLSADHLARLDDFTQRFPGGLDFTLMRVAISAHTVANGFNENVFYYGDSVGNFWIGTDHNPGVEDAPGGAVDSVSQVNIPELVNAGQSGGFTLLNPSLADCTDDQATVTGIAVSPVSDLADFGLCGVIGEVVYVSVHDFNGCASDPSNQPFRTRIFAFAFADSVNGLAPAGVLQILRNPLSNMAGLAVDDNGSLYFQLVDFLRLTSGTIFKVTEIPRVVANCETSPRVNRVIANVPGGSSLRLDSALGSPGSPALTSGGYRLTNYSGPAATFGNIVAMACGPSNTVYAAVAQSFGVGNPNETGPFANPAELGETPSMIISFADCEGGFDSCTGQVAGIGDLGGSLPIENGIADATKSGVALIQGVNNFRVFAQGKGRNLRNSLKVDMQIDFTIFSGITVDEEGTVYVISGGTPANVGSDPSPLLGEILSFPDSCPADRRADFIDLRGDVLPPASNFGDGDSDRFDHIFWQAPIDLIPGTAAGITGLARGFLRYLNRAAPNPIQNLPNGDLQEDDDTNGPIIFESFDPSHQVAGGDRQGFGFQGDDSNGLGSPTINGQLQGGFEFLFGETSNSSLPVWNGLFLNSNGSVSFGAGDTDSTPTNPDFRAGLPKLAAAWADLNTSSRSKGFLNTFPVQALGFANINSFKVRWINVPEFGMEACGSSNSFSIYLYDDGTGADENDSQGAQEGPTDLRFRRVGLGLTPRQDGSGQFCFEYSRMDLLGDSDHPVIVGYSVGGLDPIRPIPGINIGNTARDLEETEFSDCLIGSGNEPTIFEFFNSGSKARVGGGGEVTLAQPDFDLRFAGNDPRLCTPVSQFDLNQGRACFFVGTPPPSPCLGIPAPVITLNSPQDGTEIIDLNEFFLSGSIRTDQMLPRVHLKVEGERGDKIERNIRGSVTSSPPSFGLSAFLTNMLFPGMNMVTVEVEDSCNNVSRALIKINFIPPFSRTPSACVPGQPTKQVIDFENIDAGTQIKYQFLGSNGVVFPIFNPDEPAVTADIGGSRVLTTATAGTGDIIPTVVPINAQFLEPQKMVRLKGRSAATRRVLGTLRAFNRQNGGEVVAEDGPKELNISGVTFTVNSSGKGDIYRVEFRTDAIEPPFIDDLEFERECSPQPVGDETVDLFIEGIEITQATNPVISPQGRSAQPYSGVPLIGDRYTVVRVYAGVRGTSLPINRVSARLFGFSGTGAGASFSMGDLEPLEGFAGPAAQPIAIKPGDSLAKKRADTSLSWNFLLPLDWVRGFEPIKLVAVINSSNTVLECSAATCVSNNEFTVFDISFVKTNDINVLPVSVTINKGSAKEKSTPPKGAECTFRDFLTVQADPSDPNSPTDRCPFNPDITVFVPGFFQRVFPIREGGVAIHAIRGHLDRKDSFESNRNFNQDLLDDMKSKFGPTTGFIFGLPGRAHVNIPGTFYFGLNPEGGGGIATRGKGLALSVVGFQGATSHEIGHTVGLKHTPHENGQCSKGSCDTDWPFPHGGLGEFGFDTRHWVVIDPGSPPAGPHNHDLMINTRGEWISARNYCRMISALGGGSSDYCKQQESLSAKAQASSIDPQPQPNETQTRAVFPASIPQQHFVIRGRIPSDGAAVLFPIYNLVPNIEPEPPQDPGTYTLELQDKDGGALLTHRFDPPEVTSHDEPERGDFLELVPFLPDAARVVLRQDNKVLATRTRSPNPPSVQVLSPNGGEIWESSGKQLITWQATDADAGSSLLSMVQYSCDGGQTWLTLGIDLAEKSLEVNLSELIGSDRALVRVLCTDGFNVAMDQSDAFFKVAKKGPNALILDAPENSIVFDNVPRSLIAVGNDLEDGALSDEAFTWSIDDSREVSGRYLNLQNLSLGQHTITLTAKDSDGFVTRVSLPRPIDVLQGRVNASECCKLTIICPNNIEVFANPGAGSAIVNYRLPRVSGQRANIICSPPSGASFPVGITIVNCAATDADGNAGRCAFEVQVKSVSLIACPADVILFVPAGQSSAIVNYPPPVVNTPHGATVCAPPSGSSFPVGTTTVTCNSTDLTGNLLSCSFSATIARQVNADVMCLQDDSDRSMLRINFITGDYKLTDCAGFELVGTGTISRQGDIITLRHDAPDRRVLAHIDVSVRRGSATIQMLSPARIFVITDRDITDNTCLCG